MAPPTVIDLTSERSSDSRGVRNPLQTVSNKPIAKAKPAAKKRATPNKIKAHVLLWIPHNGTKASTWPKLRVMGVFSTKEKAMAVREDVLTRHDECGHGDISVGPTWHDEIDLVVKPADCFFDEGRAE